MTPGQRNVSGAPGGGVLLALCVCLASPCPPGCCCLHPELLVLCESLGLRSLPRSVPLATSALSVARNQLCNVDHLLRPFSHLQELSLSHNLLARFPRGLPPSLEALLLQDNRIAYITSGVLRHLGNLTRLDLEANRISAVQPGALEGLSKLQVLTLRGNRLSSLALKLPASLTYLDVSANGISVLALPPLPPLVHLQVLKLNSNCLRSVPENAFDGLPRLTSVDLTNNLWVCKCDILYLYRWLLSGRLQMATGLVCAEPGHLAQHLLLNLSVVAICPHVLKPNQRTLQAAVGSARGRKLEAQTVTPTTHGSLESRTTIGTTVGLLSKDIPKTREAQKCQNITGLNPQNATAADGTRPNTLSQQTPAVVVSLLAVLCVLVLLLLLALLLVLKMVLLRQQRVAPLDVGSGG